MPVETDHLFCPQMQVAHVVNSRFLGLYRLADLPRYYRPSEEAVSLADGLVSKMITDGTINFVFSDIRRAQSSTWEDLSRHGLYYVTGQQNLPAELGFEGTDLLFDEGSLDNPVNRYKINM